MESGGRNAVDAKIGRVMLLQRPKTERKVVETEIGERKPRFGETLTLSFEGRQVRARITAVWRPPAPASEICTMRADEIG